MACNYHIGRLKPFVYLIKNLIYKDRNDKAYIVSGEVYKVNADLVTFREAESFSGRFKFTTTVNVTFNSMMDDTFIRSNQFHIVVEDGTGLQFLVSPEFVADCTTELTISDKQTTQLFIEDNGWQQINFIECEYSKVFNGSKITTEINFTIPIEDNDWHYDLISFPDNRWHMKIESNGETIEGFNMFPQYTRQTSEQPTGTDIFDFKMRGIDIGTSLNIDVSEDITRWVSSQVAYGELQYICIEFDRYVKEVKQKYDENDGWVNTGEIRAGALVQVNSYDCGYRGDGYLYKWMTVPNDFICEGTIKYEKQRLYYSEDGGDTWESTDQIRAGNLIELDSADCDYHHIEWKWDGGYICEATSELETWLLLDTYICEVTSI